MRGGVPLAPGKEEKRDGKELEEGEDFLFRLNSSKQGGGGVYFAQKRRRRAKKGGVLVWRVRRLRLQWKREGRRRASIVHSRRNVVWKDFIAREGEGEQRVRKGLGEERALNECKRKEG